MNGGEVILADEPTGALDTHSGNDVLNILKDLHQQGHTVVIVTHDMSIAEHAQRIVELRDGEVITDRQMQSAESVSTATVEQEISITSKPPLTAWKAQRDRLQEAFKMAILADGGKTFAHRTDHAGDYYWYCLGGIGGCIR